MPAYAQHIEQAEHNESTLAFWHQQGKQTEFSDWYVTVSFYAALHYFEAMITVVKPTAVGDIVEHTSDHHSRNNTMRSAFNRIYGTYARLYQMSKAARYNCHTPRSHKWPLAEKYLADVKQECGKLTPGTAKQ